MTNTCLIFMVVMKYGPFKVKTYDLVFSEVLVLGILQRVCQDEIVVKLKVGNIEQWSGWMRLYTVLYYTLTHPKKYICYPCTLLPGIHISQ